MKVFPHPPNRFHVDLRPRLDKNGISSKDKTAISVIQEAFSNNKNSKILLVTLVEAVSGHTYLMRAHIQTTLGKAAQSY